MLLALVENNQVKTKKVYIVQGEPIEPGGDLSIISSIEITKKLGLGVVVGVVVKKFGDIIPQHNLLVKTNKSLETKSTQLQEANITINSSTLNITLTEENLANVTTETPTLATSNTTYTISDITIGVGSG